MAVDVGVDDEGVRRALDGSMHQRHGLGCGGALVEHRGVGHLEPRQFLDHRLEIQQCLEPALTDLRLVWRVGGVPGRVLEDVALQHRRGQRVEVALSDHRDGHGVRVGHPSQFSEGLLFGGGRRQLIESRGYSVGRQSVENACGKRLFG